MGRRIKASGKSVNVSELVDEINRLSEENEALHKEIEVLHETVGLSSLLTKALMDALVAKGMVTQADIEKNMGQMVSTMEPCAYKDDENMCNWDWSTGPCPRNLSESEAENCEALPNKYGKELEDQSQFPQGEARVHDCATCAQPCEDKNPANSGDGAGTTSVPPHVTAETIKPEDIKKE